MIVVESLVLFNARELWLTHALGKLEPTERKSNKLISELSRSLSQSPSSCSRGRFLSLQNPSPISDPQRRSLDSSTRRDQMEAIQRSPATEFPSIDFGSLNRRSYASQFWAHFLIEVPQRPATRSSKKLNIAQHNARSEFTFASLVLLANNSLRG